MNSDKAVADKMGWDDFKVKPSEHREETTEQNKDDEFDDLYQSK